MKSVVLVGAPLKSGRQITNPNVENVILISGEKDAISLGDGYHSFYNNPVPVNEFNIILKDCDHFDYTYDPNETSPDPLKVQAARFIGEVAARSRDVTSLNRFLSVNPGVTYDSAKRIFEVDLSKVVYEQ